jgi:uroporphyrinogen decarboxylase
LHKHLVGATVGAMSHAMSPKQRVHAALRRQPVDRLPVFMWFHPDTARSLARLLELPVERVGEAMGNDVLQTWVNNNYAMEGIVHERDGEGHTDFWGVRWEKQGAFNQPVGFPLAEAGEEELAGYRFPTGKMDFLLGLMDPVVERAAEFFIGCDVSPCAFEMYWRLRGLEEALVDVAARPRLAERMLRRCGDFARALSERACRELPLDWLWTGDDVAGQNGMILSPAAWRDLVKPVLAEIFAVGKAAGLWVAFHCCGALRPIIPDLVEIGLDVLNPVQAGCPGMDPVELAREFGKRLSFMGGVDTQGLLPFASETEVRRAISGLIEAMTAGGGGYILAASHTIPPETPEANIFAMYDVAGISREEIFDRAAGIRRATGAPRAAGIRRAAGTGLRRRGPAPSPPAGPGA